MPLPDMIYIARHGQSIGNILGLKHESLRQIPNREFWLTPKGESQADALAEFVRREGILAQCDEAHTSTFLRAQQTLDRVLRASGSSLELQVIDHLDEWWRGVLYTVPDAELKEQYADVQRSLREEGDHLYCPPEGESGQDVERRVLRYLRSLKGTPFIGGHGHFAMFLERILTGGRIRGDCHYPIPRNGSLWLFERKGKKYERHNLFTPDI